MGVLFRSISLWRKEWTTAGEVDKIEQIRGNVLTYTTKHKATMKHKCFQQKTAFFSCTWRRQFSAESACISLFPCVLSYRWVHFPRSVLLCHFDKLAAGIWNWTALVSVNLLLCHQCKIQPKALYCSTLTSLRPLYLWHHEPTFSCSSLVESKPTWLCPEELKSKAIKTKACLLNTY